MFFDLNIGWPVEFPHAVPSKKGKAKQANDAATSTTPQTLALSSHQRDDLRTLVQDAAQLGFRTIAFNVNVKSRFAGDHRAPFAAASPPFPDLLAPQTVPGIKQLSRMTLVMDEASMGKHGHGITSTNQSTLLEYDLLAARPFNDASFSALCLSMCELKPIGIDIISLDFAESARPPFFMRRTLVSAAIANGAVFEVCYGRALSHRQRDGEGALRARRNIIAATRDLLRVTNGRNVILSSGATEVLGLRGPYDVINLASVLGMNPSAAREAITSTCRSLLLRAETRKSFRGVVSGPTVKIVSVNDATVIAEEQKDRVEGATQTAVSPEVRIKPAKSAKKRKDREEPAVQMKKRNKE